MFLTYVIRIVFSFFQEITIICEKSIIWLISPSFTPWIRPISYVLTCVIEVDKGEILKQYFKHICVLLLFFQEKLPLFGESE